LIFLIVELGLEYQNWASLSFVQQSLCLSQAYGLYPLQQSCFVMIFLYFVRYFSIIRVNTMKNSVKVEEEEGENVVKAVWYVRVLKLLSQMWLVMLLALLYFLFATIINTIIILGTNGQFLCEFQTLVNLRIANGVQLIVVYIFTVLLLVGDILGNLKTVLRCQLITYIFKKDPFYFRLQIALFVPYMLYDTASELYFVIMIQSFPDLIYQVIETEAMNTVNFDLLLLIDVMLPLVLTIFIFVFNLFLEEKKEEHEVEKLLRDPKGHRLMLDFLKKEYNIENIYCWDDIKAYRKPEKHDPGFKNLSEDLKKEALLVIAKRICDKYFNGESSFMEVNVPNNVKSVIWEKIEEKNVDCHLFDEVLFYVRENLTESYSMLCLSTDFKKYQLEKDIESSLLDKRKVTRLGIIGYFRKLCSNFRKNLKRKTAMRISRRNRISLISNNSSMASISAIELEEVAQNSNQNVEIVQTTNENSVQSNQDQNGPGLDDNRNSDEKLQPSTHQPADTVVTSNEKVSEV